MAVSSNMDILKTMLHTWTDDEVTEAWRLISAEGNRRKKAKSKDVKGKLYEGAKVSFQNGGTKVTGRVERVKYKKAIVAVKNGKTTVRWDVPFSSLTFC